MTTIFTKIINGDIPSYKIYEDEKHLAFLDIQPFTEGHTLVIPKKEYEFLWEMPANEAAELMKVVNKIGKHYIENIGVKFVDTLTMGRLVPHVHIHLIPHNGENTNWSKALNILEPDLPEGQEMLDKEKGEEIADKFKL